MPIKVSCHNCGFENDILTSKSEDILGGTINIENLKFFVTKPNCGFEDVVGGVIRVYCYIRLQVLPDVGDDTSASCASTGVGDVPRYVEVAALVLCFL